MKRLSLAKQRQSSDLPGIGKALRRYEPPWISAERYWRRKSREALSDATARKSGEMIRAAMESHRSATDQDCLGLPRTALELIGREKHGQGVVENCPAPERSWTEPGAVRRKGTEKH